MSDATASDNKNPSKTDPDNTMKKPTLKEGEGARVSQNKQGNGLAVLALLVGLGGAAAAGWSVWNTQQLTALNATQLIKIDDQKSKAVTLTSKMDVLTKEGQSISSRLAQVPKAEELEAQNKLLNRLQSDQKLLNQRFESVLGARHQTWRLEEAEHLLRLSSLRLSALQDTKSAADLLEAVDEIVKAQNDPAAFAVRKQLAKDLEVLRAAPEIDRSGLFLQVGAIREQSQKLTVLNPSFKMGDSDLSHLATENNKSRWGQWLEGLSKYVRIDFSAPNNVKPLLAGQSLAQVKLALSLALDQTQWAAINGQEKVYQRSIHESLDILDNYFDPNDPYNKALRKRISGLDTIPINIQTPDLSASLAALKLYVASKGAVTPDAGQATETSADGDTGDTAQ